ncbi:MAG: acetyl-CoA carboxylase biotin carboxyl carrier protein subunit [Paludibacter sp.]|nr:acetyl-CoA carboxylase biotin carboxyl carrier protein subunit [Paludibacter sp.]MDD4197858.1 acetyl-CoA carboxylase biotin carboxyl carrier protein subunit [Paludibacter sp.]MDD4428152.1 acetyl-CoA carboxylase biotin carboxyl carrier protein subunit [Paludibacter sp.]
MGTSYKYKRDASRLFIALRDNGKRYKIYIPRESNPVIDGNEQEIDFIEQEDFQYTFEWNGKRFHCELVARDQNKATVHVNGVEYKFSLESIFSYIRKGMISDAEDKNTSVQIKAPMPGKIIDIFLDEGDLVNVGEPILTLEAMKMQNEITADCNGVIQKIRVNHEQSVMKDELLVEIQSIDV